MKKLYMLFIVCLVVFLPVKLNAFSGLDFGEVWTKQTGTIQSDSFKSVIKTSDGNILAVGLIGNSADLEAKGGLDGYAVLYNQSGDVIWSHRYGGDQDDILTDVIETTDGSYLLAGYSRSSFGSSFNHGVDDGWIIKIDANGAEIWTQVYGSYLRDTLSGIVETSTGYIASGTTAYGGGANLPIGGSSNNDGWILTVNKTNGNTISNKTYGTNTDDNFTGIESLVDGSIVAVGFTQGQVGTSAAIGASDGWAIKIDQSNQILWNNQYGSTKDDAFFDIVKGTDGNLYMVGDTYGVVDQLPEPGHSDGWVFSIDLNGAQLLSKRLGIDDDTYLYEVDVTPNGVLAIGGLTQFNFLTNSQTSNNSGLFSGVKLDGTILWNKNIDSTKSDVIDGVAHIDASRYVVAGTTQGAISTQPNIGGSDAFVMSLAAQYNVSFESNGGTQIDNQTVFENDLVIEPSNPTKQNYTFDKWYKDIDLKIPWDFTTDTITQDTVLYAGWIANKYTVSFESNGGTPVAPIVGSYNELISAPNEPTKTGYTFAGWYQENTLTNVWDFNVNVVTQDTILYAKWVKQQENKKVNLYFDLNGKQGNKPTTQSLLPGELALKPTDPYFKGYSFKGWNTKKDGSGMTWDFNKSKMPANNVTLYAQWTKELIPVTGDSSNAILFSTILVFAALSLTVLNKNFIKKNNM